jgi:hypothetical protein
VLAELRDLVRRGNAPTLHIRDEEVEFVSNAADVCVKLSITGNTSYNMHIDAEVFDDIRDLLSHCSRARTLVLLGCFVMKIAEDDSSMDRDVMERDRVKMVSDHVVPLLEHHQQLLHYYVAARFINYTLTDSGAWSGKWKQPMTE